MLNSWISSRDRFPEAWERYFVGVTATAPGGFEGVREQLELYGSVAAEERSSAKQRGRTGRQPSPAWAPLSRPGLDWGALQQWRELYSAHLA